MTDWAGTPEQEIETLREMVERRDAENEALRGRVAELESVCTNIHRDLSIRAEPHDWDNPSSCKVVNLSAGYWDQLNDVLDEKSKLSGLSADAWILRKQAEAIEACCVKANKTIYLTDYAGRMIGHCNDYAQRLRTQASELEAGGDDEPEE